MSRLMLGFSAKGLGFRVWGLGLGVWGLCWDSVLYTGPFKAISPNLTLNGGLCKK